MKPLYLSKLKAIQVFEELENNDFKKVITLDDDYQQIREELLEYWNTLKKIIIKEYELDLKFGLKLYEVFNKYLDLNDDIIVSSNIEFWIYVNIHVIPEILKDRWLESSKNLTVRYFNHNKRNYSSSLWWYIHLSWQGSIEETLQVLEGNSTDTIVQLNERVGKGYVLPFTRALMKENSLRKSSMKIFRKLMVLNTLYKKSIEPRFYKDGYEGYVNMLFDKLNVSKKRRGSL